MYKVTFSRLNSMGRQEGLPDKEFEFEVQASGSAEAFQSGCAEMRQRTGVSHPDCYYQMSITEIKPVVPANHHHDPKKLQAHIGSLKNNLQWALSKCNMMDPHSSGGTMNELSEVLMSLRFAGTDCEAIRKEIKGISVTVPTAGGAK